VRPIEDLRASVLTKARAASAAPDLSALGGSEVDELTQSFNRLLESLEQRRIAESRLAANLVHELKNPLAAIRAAGEALQKPEMDGERRAQLGRVLERSSARLGGLATEYLELARADARLPGEQREPVDLAELVRGVCAAFRDDARFSGVELQVQAPQAVVVVGISGRLESVIANLIENAATASLPRGRVEVAIEADGDAARITIADSGPGIGEDVLPRLFERFVTTRGQSGGSGLGLALCRAILEAHAGSLAAENRSGGGARFVAKLPLAES
jgi:two-component system sensor histidine kinase ChvG